MQSNKNIENKKQLIEKLQNAEWQLLMVQSVGNVAFWEYNPDEKKYWGTDAAFHLWDMNPPTDGWIDLLAVKERIHPDDRNYVTESFKRFISNKSSLNLDFRIVPENKSLIKDNKHFNVKANAVLGDEKQVTKIIGTLQDITEMKKREKELIKAKEKAEESDRLKSAFLANMSHEIRTPMNAIIGFSELLNIGDIPKEKRKEYAGIIRNKGTLLLTLIDDIIEVAKFESGHLNISKSETNLNHLLHELYQQYEQKKKQKAKDAVELKLALPERKKHFVYTDPGRLQQVLSNLLSNALKFTDIGEIEFGYQFLDDYKLQFYVKDTGTGISKEKQKVIFNRFRQVEDTATRQYSGSAGLGLTISKGIVELLGGRIWVESEPQKGTTFYFYIPYEDIKDAPARDISPEESNDFSRFNWKNKVILIAEDEELNYKFLETVLHDTQAQVLQAENGKQVIDLVKSINKIDLILMDIKMPVMNGYEATREIKKINPSIPIIAQTAYSMKDDKDKCLNAGCDDYISKPIDLHLLIAKINRLLSSK